MKTILGLDLGTNSIGWALVELDAEQHDGNIIGAGSRIIPMTQEVLGKFDAGQSISQTAERTSFRSIRRLRERHLLRRERLHRVLNILGFLPEHYHKEIDFDKHYGQFLPGLEPKLAYSIKDDDSKPEFIFKDSFNEMLLDFKKHQPNLVKDDKKVPCDWTIYYLRKKALTEKIKKEEIAWLLLNFNQKRGYYQLRGEDEEENKNKLVEFYSLKVVDVVATEDKKGQDEVWYNLHLENGWIYRRTSRTKLDWVGKTKEFIVTTELNDDGTIKKDNKEGKEKRSFRAPAEDDWSLVKKKTEFDLENSGKTVGQYIYDTLLQTPHQKIKGRLVRVIERKFYKSELESILKKQKEFHPELSDQNLYESSLNELYENNEGHRTSSLQKDFVHLFIEDIIFYQRPLKSKKSLISNCKFETRTFIKNGKKEIQVLKCIPKSHPLFQEFRLWQFLQNLRIYKKEDEVDGKLETDVNVTANFLPTEEDWCNLFDWLNDRKEITQKALLKHLKIKDIENYRWNYVEDKIYPCNETRAQIIERFAKVTDTSNQFLSKEMEEAIWHILYSVEDKYEIQKALRSFALKYHLGDSFVQPFVKFPTLKKEYGSFSAKAIKRLLPLMRMGRYWNGANIDEKTKNRIEKIITGEYDEKIRTKVREKALHLRTLTDFKGLDLWLASYIAYDRHSEGEGVTMWKKPDDIEHYLKEVFKQHSLRNPIVEQIVTETLRVVNDIWKEYGNSEEGFFDEIHVELGREMKNSKKERERITKQISENENTNLRIKALLIELLNDPTVENVRPYSPAQQEILKIFEEGVLNAEDAIPDDILKISKQAQPSSSDLTKYKLWMQQKYRSPYTGNIIPLSKLFTRAYEIEHIIPQSRFFDDSFANKIICETEVNKDKDNCTAYEYIKNNEGKVIELSFGQRTRVLTLKDYEELVKKDFGKNRGKMKRLLMEDIPDAFIERQLNDSRYISKVVKNLLSNIVREENEHEPTSKNLIVCNGSITTALKQDWGLNDVWNEIVTPRFERLNQLTNSKNFGEWLNKEGKKVFQIQMPLELQEGFNKKRIDHRHHALDALVIACTTRNHVNYLNNSSALGKGKSKEEKEKKRYDLKQKLCFKKYNVESNSNYRWMFHKPWESYTAQVKEAIDAIVVSFKQNQRVINKTVNYYQKWIKETDGKLTKQLVKQTKGQNWAIRKPMHKDTVAGSVNLKFSKQVSLSSALDSWELIIDKDLKRQIKDLAKQKYDKKLLVKFFKDRQYKWENKDVTKVEVYYWDGDNVASRVKVDESFNSAKIKSITDSGIQKIMQNHLDKYSEEKNGKVIEHPELAFSADGIDEMNRTIRELNNGKAHQPILKVRTYEPKGNKFSVGQTGNKNDKFVEAAKGTNLFFAIYIDEKGKRKFETIPLNEVIERQKQGLSSVSKSNIDGNPLLFYLSPQDLVYVPSAEELEASNSFDFRNMAIDKSKRIYKFVSCTGTQAFFVPNTYASEIVKNEMGANNKSENTLSGVQIKAVCWKLLTDRTGQIVGLIK